MPASLLIVIRFYIDKSPWYAYCRDLASDKGQRVAVLIDLRKYGELWEDFYDILNAGQCAAEPRESLESVKKRLRKGGKLNG